MNTFETDAAVDELVEATAVGQVDEVEVQAAERLLPRPRRHSENDTDATATTVIEAGRSSTGDDLEETDVVDEEAENVLIATEYFDAGYVGDEDLEEQDAETDVFVETEVEEIEVEAVEQVEELEPIGARSAARAARKAVAEAERTQRLAPTNRRHGVLGLAVLLVLAYQVVPAALPGGHVGVNAFLAAMGLTLWSSRRIAPLQAKGGRRRAELMSDGSLGRRRNFLGWAGVVLLAVACWAPDPTNVAGRFSPLAMLATVALLIGVTAEPPGLVAKAAAAAPLRMLGRLTFPLLGYLVLLLGVLPATAGWEPNTILRFGAAALAVLGSYLTMRHLARSQAAAIERARHRNPYVVGAIASLAAIGLACTAPGGSDAQVEKFQAAVESSPLPAAAPAAEVPFADGCWSTPPAYVSATCSYGADSSKVTVALTGDQTAASWLPALQGLAMAKGWRVTSYLASDCSPSVGSTDPACTAWIERTGKAISGGGYALIVVAGGTGEAGGEFGEHLRRQGLTVIGMPDLLAPHKN